MRAYEYTCAFDYTRAFRYGIHYVATVVAVMENIDDFYRGRLRREGRRGGEEEANGDASTLR